MPLTLSTNVTPLGRAPLSLSVGVGKPVVVTVNVPNVPVVNVAATALVIAGTWFGWNSTAPMSTVPLTGEIRGLPI